MTKVTKKTIEFNYCNEFVARIAAIEFIKNNKEAFHGSLTNTKTGNFRPINGREEIPNLLRVEKGEYGYRKTSVNCETLEDLKHYNLSNGQLLELIKDGNVTVDVRDQGWNYDWYRLDIMENMDLSDYEFWFERESERFKEEKIIFTFEYHEYENP
jgi:hypothetical protein